MVKKVMFYFLLVCVVVCKSLDAASSFGTDPRSEAIAQPHKIQRRFIDPSQTFGSFPSPGLTRIRAKRSEEECEKLRLCKLHAQANRNFVAAFELYFVNKENARLWDHNNGRTVADCYKRFGGCYRR